LHFIFFLHFASVFILNLDLKLKKHKSQPELMFVSGDNFRSRHSAIRSCHHDVIVRCDAIGGRVTEKHLVGCAAGGRVTSCDSSSSSG